MLSAPLSPSAIGLLMKFFATKEEPHIAPDGTACYFMATLRELCPFFFVEQFNHRINDISDIHTLSSTREILSTIHLHDNYELFFNEDLEHSIIEILREHPMRVSELCTALKRNPRDRHIEDACWLLRRHNILEICPDSKMRIIDHSRDDQPWYEQ